MLLYVTQAVPVTVWHSPLSLSLCCRAGVGCTSEHGQARLWDPDEPLGSFPLTQTPEEQVVALSTDRENHVLVAGDTAGLIAVFDMKDYCMVTGKVSTTTTRAKVLPSTITLLVLKHYIADYAESTHLCTYNCFVLKHLVVHI